MCFKSIIFKLTIQLWCCEIGLRWMMPNLTNEKSTLVNKVMAWCHQATIHYLNQCWPRSKFPYGITRPHWVKSVTCGWHGYYFTGVITRYVLLINIWSLQLPWGECCRTSPWKANFGLGNGLVSLGNVLTLKHRKTRVWVVSTVATDALVLKHQAISIHNAD